jgi:hypothetical protein
MSTIILDCRQAGKVRFRGRLNMMQPYRSKHAVEVGCQHLRQNTAELERRV